MTMFLTVMGIIYSGNPGDFYPFIYLLNNAIDAC